MILAALAIGLGSDALAQRRGGDDARRQKREIPEQLKRFDANGDGTLDEDERKAVREWIDARQRKRGERGRRGRRGGEGTPPQRGRRRGGDGTPPERRGRGTGELPERLKPFDKNGDGKLDEAERKAVREAIGKRRRRGGTPPKPAPGRRGGQRRPA